MTWRTAQGTGSVKDSGQGQGQGGLGKEGSGVCCCSWIERMGD